MLCSVRCCNENNAPGITQLVKSMINITKKVEHIIQIKWIKSNKHIATATHRITLFDGCAHELWRQYSRRSGIARFTHHRENRGRRTCQPSSSVPLGPSRRFAVCRIQSDTCSSSCSFAAVVHVSTSSIIIIYYSSSLARQTHRRDAQNLRSLITVAQWYPLNKRNWVIYLPVIVI